ncbi:invasin domain 3-containing protein [Halostella sp. PRR32]|uniref:invasin domain 3-containing protein n=1 Tax=Halostella sp. PRR32 TaxID=3098147 RepID=UPI002B1E6BC4|nr:invasin domain 3-containing protein [Halostella sp. PRR32]
MQFGDDERAAAIQVGATLLFGMLIISMALYQATVVPDQNKGIEFNHNQKVQGQMQDLRNAVVSVPGGGNGGSVTLDLGTTYPSRTLFLNPGPPSGSLRTVGTNEENVNVSVAHAVATDGEVEDFWSGDARNYTTGALVYEPRYHEYQNPPTTVYEHSLLYNKFRDANLTVSDQTIVNDRQITLVTLDGNLSENGMGSASVTARSVSASTNTVAVEADSDPINITVPTRLDNDTWSEALREEYASNGGHIVGQYHEDVSGAPYALLTIELEEGPTYDLQMARVGVGTGASAGSAERYITDIEGGGSVQTGSTQEVTVEVRDTYNNPVSGKTVNLSATDGEFENASGPPAADITRTTNSDGRVTVTYNAPDSKGTDTVTANVSASPNASEKVEFEMNVESSGGEASLGVGSGGTSVYSPSSNTARMSVANGKWTAITKTDQLILSDTDPVYVSGDDYVKLRYSVENRTTSFDITVEAFREPDGSNPGGSVEIYSSRTGSSTTANLNDGAVDAILDSDRSYDGTDIINRESYRTPSAGFVDNLRTIADLDNSSTTYTTTTINGQVNATYRGEALLTAVEPDPSTTNDRTEFVQIHFENSTETSGWTIADSDQSETLPAERLQGEYFLTKNETAFLNAHGSVSANRVYETSLTLDNGGEALTLTDANGELRDEAAYGSESTSNGWSVSVGTSEVGYRTAYSDEGYRDTDERSDWGTQSESVFFGGSSGQVRYNGDGYAYDDDGSVGIREGVTFSVENTATTDVTVTDVTVDPANANIDELSDPVAGNGINESELYIETSNTDGVADADNGVTLPSTLDLSGGSGYNGAQEAVIGSGDGARFWLYRFLQNGGEHDMVCEEVEITVEFENEPSQTFTVTPEDGVGGACDATGSPTEGIAFRGTDNSLKTIDSNGRLNDYSPDKPLSTGPMTADLDDDSATDLPYMDQNNNIEITDLNGDVRRLVDGGSVTQTRLAVGTWDGDTSVFFVNGQGELSRVTGGNSAQAIDKKPSNSNNFKPIAASSAVGVADMNGDGDADLVFVNSNQDLVFVEDKKNGGREVINTGINLNTADATGAPAEYDADGAPEVPYVDGNGVVNLADENGNDGALTSGSIESPVGTFDWTGDGTPEVIYVGLGPNGNNYYLKYATDSGDVGYVRDTNGDKVRVNDNGVGAS